jgi:hypothetical protein
MRSDSFYCVYWSVRCQRLRQALWIWQSLDSQYIIALYGVTDKFGPFTSLVCPWMGGGTLTNYLESTGQNLSLAGRFRIVSLLLNKRVLQCDSDCDM